MNELRAFGKIVVSAAAATWATMGSAQSFNIDLDGEFGSEVLGIGAPSSAFGAAANQPGYWNKIRASGPPPALLKGLDGNLTGVLLSGPQGGTGGGQNIEGLTGDYRLLMADARSVSFPMPVYTLSGLASGKYKAFVYAVSISGGSTNAPVTILESITSNPQIVTGPMPMNTFTEGISHSVHVVEVKSGVLTLQIAPVLPQAYFNGFQIVQLSNYIAPTSYLVTQGLNFGGSLSSILTSDDQRASILNDEFDTNGEFEFTSTLPAGTVSQLKFKFEGRASRSDLSQFLKMRNYSTGIYTNVNVQTATLSDSIAEGSITSGANNYFSASREVKAKATWIPQLDVDAMDGWVEGCDQAMWEMVF